MTLESLFLLTARLLSVVMLIQSLEFALLLRKKSFFKIWSFENIKHDLEGGLPFSSSIIQALFSEKAFRLTVAVQIFAASFANLFPSAILFSILFLTHLLICIRFRGSFNGGSDMMTFVVLTGVLIGLGGQSETWQMMGLLYIAIHGVYSYFKAGLAKIVQADWRRGRALPAFMNRSLYFDVQRMSQILKSKHTLSLLLCWSALIFELAAIGIPIVQGFAFIYLAAALIFHFIIFAGFGLNRFFWVWLSAWPAIIYVTQYLY